ncbi:MAG: translocation/assembly module TamB domain-containing protein [Gracilimonas sp.]
MSTDKKNILPKMLKGLAWALLSLILIAALARLSLKTSWVHSFAKKQAESIANESLNGTLTIADIDGDLWNDFSIYDIHLSQKDTLLSLDSLRITYDIWSLLNSNFSASNINISGLKTRILETDDERFNVPDLLKTEATEDTSTAGSAFGIDIQNLQVDNSSIFVHSPTFLPDSSLSIEKLSASAAFSFKDEISASLSSLSFRLIEGRLPEPISFSSSASYEDEMISLNELVIETGRTLFRVNGFTGLQDSSLAFEGVSMPLSFQDFQPYLDYQLPENNLQLSLGISGSFRSLQVELQAEGDGFDDLVVVSDVSISETPTLNLFGINGKNLDLGYFTNDSIDAEIGDFQFSLEGNISEDYENMDLTWGFTLNEIQYQDYYLQILFGSGTIIEGNSLATIQAKDGQDEIALITDIKSIFSEQPDWSLQSRVEHIDLGWWLKNPELNGELSFRAKANGKGFELTDDPWDFSITPSLFTKRTIITRDSASSKVTAIKPVIAKDTIVINGQKFSDLGVTGDITKDRVEAAGFIQLIEDKLNFDVAVSDFLGELPSYSFIIETRDFNAQEVYGAEDFETSINLAATGNGQYFDPEQIRLNANLRIDSSFVNGASFDSLNVNAGLSGTILTVHEGNLLSEVIEGSFSGRRNLLDQTDPDNNFALDMQLKNVQPLASLVGAEIFNATGTITGNVTEIIESELLFDGNIKLNDIRYDSLFTANTIEGSTKISIREEYGYDFSLDIDQPSFSNVMLQDLEFSAVGISTVDSLSGNFTLDIVSGEAGEISQSGNYDINTETLKTSLTWDTFDFQTPSRLLSLQRPFRLNYRDNSIQSDTLMISSDEGTYLNLAIPYADSLSQQIWAEGHDFDFGIIQDIIFGERFVDGILSGDLEIDNSPDQLSGNGALGITNLTYQSTELDRIGLNFELASERLNANMSVTLDGQEAIAGQLDIPFVPQAPEKLDDSFFEEPVSGEIRINPINLDDFQSLLQNFQITQTTGFLSFNGSLSGSAGNPDFEGRFNLQDPTLSGIRIDSAFASFEYYHQQKKMSGITEINARGQKAASISAEIPISMDFRTFEFIMPDESDMLSFNLITDNFNLSVFNDFLNKDYMRRLRGTLNADINIAGTKENLTPKGSLRLSGGELNIPIAGINLTRISSELGFSDSGNLLLNSFNMTSGSGSFSADGSIDLDGITPSNLDINARATRFRLANTSDYNLTIDLNSTLSGPPTTPTASGQLNIKNGFIYLQDFGERSVETVELEEENASSFSPYDSLAIDMQFVIERDFLIRNRRYLDLEIELTGELDAQKQTGDEDLQLFGTLDAERGYVRPLGKQFTVEEGRFTFSGPLTEPDIYINTSYIPQSSQKEGDPIVLYYIIEGNAIDPEFRFESEPQMEQQDIICYTLFNKPCYALESWQQVVSGGSGSSPTDLLVGVLLDEFETLATQELGIDVVQIETTRSGGTSIRTGWYLNRKTFFAIVNEISGVSPKTIFILEYLLNKNLDLIITQGDDNRQGIDLRWQYDY